tara:strand:- start:816 stop:1055 length:240 start_codon:yes stop_codon:yes gene_type:complete
MKQITIHHTIIKRTGDKLTFRFMTGISNYENDGYYYIDTQTVTVNNHSEFQTKMRKLATIRVNSFLGVDNEYTIVDFSI